MKKIFKRFFGKGEKMELPEISFPETEERLKRELQDGTVIAEQLVRHVHTMGANGCKLYVEFSEGARYCVSVEPVQEREDA